MLDSAFSIFNEIKKIQGFESPLLWHDTEFAQWSWFHAGWASHRKVVDAAPKAELAATDSQQPLAAGVKTTLSPGFICASCGERFYGNHTCIPRSSTTVGGNVG